MIWQTQKLNDLCEILIGGTPSRGVVEYWENGTLPWVSIRDMSREGDVIENTNEKITEKGARESNVKLIPKGSLLFSFKLSIGKLALAGSDLYTNEAIAALIIKDEKQLDQSFLRYYISQMVFGDVITAVKGSTLNKEKIKNLEIPLPPLTTQRQIVTILDEKFAKLREAKRLRQEAIGDTEKILTTTLREIFEEGKEKGWEEKTIQECCTLKSGTTVSPELEKDNGDLLYLKVGDMNMIENQIEINTSSRFCESEKANLKQVIPVGSVIFPKRGGAIFTNKKRIITKPTIVDLNIMAMIPAGSLQSKFLYYWFSMLDLKTINSGSSIPQINNVDINPLKIIIPPLSEQKQIVTHLDALTEKLRMLRELQQSQLEDMKKLEKAYLREAFRGEL